MSGDTTHEGYKVGQSGFDLALPAAVAIFSFVLGSLAGTMITSSRFRYARRLLFLSITAMLALDISITCLTPIMNETVIAVLSFTIGMMNTTLTRVGKQEVNITFVTGMLSELGGHLAHAVKIQPLKNARGMWNTHLCRALLLSVMWGILFNRRCSGRGCDSKMRGMDAATPAAHNARYGHSDSPGSRGLEIRLHIWETKASSSKLLIYIQ